MGLIFRRRIRTSRHTHVNVSTHGASASGRVGRVTANTRGRATVRLGKGWSFRIKI